MAINPEKSFQLQCAIPRTLATRLRLECESRGYKTSFIVTNALIEHFKAVDMIEREQGRLDALEGSRLVNQGRKHG